MKKTVGSIIVAAGLSSRMKDFKPLMKIGSSTIIESTINNFKLLGVDEIVVVTGYRENVLKNSINCENIRFVHNSNYEITHMFDSICLGLKEIRNKVDLIFITPADSPFVQQFTLKRMMDRMKNSNYEIIQPSYEGKCGHPLLISSEYVNTILKHDGTNGLQGVITYKSDSYLNMSFVDPGIVMDADKKPDYQALLKYNEIKGCPSVEMCEKMLNHFQATDLVKSHSHKVMEVALSINEKLKKRGLILDKDAIVAASMLHDIAKGNPHHGEVGANWLMEMGFEIISNIVREHMELKELSPVIREKEVVYLADKLVMENKICSIEERFLLKEELFKSNEIITKVVEKRKHQAMLLYDIIFGTG